MRTIRRLATGLALLSVVPAAAAAQDSRPFIDSWFWGVKGGATTVRSGLESEVAPTVGIDWLITRTRAGLYLSVEQAFFDDMRGRATDEFTGVTSDVQFENLRSASFALVAFPGNFEKVRPYAGVGLAFNLVQRARSENPFPSQQELEVIEEHRSRTSYMFMGGVQGELNGMSLFAQAKAMPKGSGFLLAGGGGTYVLEAGLRLNVGSAIERLDR